MFRRKEEAFDFEGEENAENPGAPAQASSNPSTGAPSPSDAPRAAVPAQPAAAPVNRAPAPAPAASAPAFRPAQPAQSPISSSPSSPAPIARTASAPSPASAAGKSSKRILTVGNDILLKGEIATCDRLVIEGAVDATLKDVHTVEIAETGSFKGTAEIEDAEISGIFEGTLVVRNRLTIYATGKVRGKISFGEVEIERGGQLTGEIAINGQNAKKDTKAA